MNSLQDYREEHGDLVVCLSLRMPLSSSLKGRLEVALNGDDDGSGLRLETANATLVGVKGPGHGNNRNIGVRVFIMSYLLQVPRTIGRVLYYT